MKTYLALFSTLLFVLPAITFAQGIQDYVSGLLTFIGNVLVPFLLGVAFLFFAINVIRFFVIESTSEDGREKAKALAIYGVLAFVIIIIFWGVVNLLADSFAFSGKAAPTPDYIERGNGGGAPAEPYQWQPTGGAST